MLLRPGMNVQDCENRLGNLLLTAYSHTDAAGFVWWVHDVENVLRSYCTRIPMERLYTQSFWQLWQASPAFRGTPDLLRHEQARQVEWLTEVRDTVKEMRERFAPGSSTVAVLDTNVLLHHRPLTDVKWDAVVGERLVRLVVPLRVVDELDEKKVARSPQLRRRAGKRIKQLERLVASGSDGVRPGVSIELVASVDLDPEAYRGPRLPPDVEVLDICESLAAYGGSHRTFLVTGDLGMQLRAKARRIPLKLMPGETEQPLGTPDRTMTLRKTRSSSTGSALDRST